MSGQLDPALRRSLAVGALSAVDGTRRDERSPSASGRVPTGRSRPRCTWTANSRSSTTCSTTSTGPRWRTRSRSASRSSTIASSSSARRSRPSSRSAAERRSTSCGASRRGLVPADVIKRPKVSFFRGEVDEWLSRQLDGRGADYLLGSNPRYAEFLRRRQRRRAADEAPERKRAWSPPPAARDPAPRGLALVVPPARARTAEDGAPAPVAA